MSQTASLQTLKDVYEAARGQKTPTLHIRDMGGAPGYGVEAHFVDRRDDSSIGQVWYGLMRDLMDHAETKGDFEGGNPNYKVVDRGLREMIKMRQSLGQPT